MALNEEQQNKLRELKIEKLKAEREQLLSSQVEESSVGARDLTEQDLSIGTPPEQTQPEGSDLLGKFVPPEAQATLGKIGGVISGEAEEDLGLLETARVPFQIAAQTGETLSDTFQEAARTTGGLGLPTGLADATSTVVDLAIPQTELEVLMDVTNPIGFAFSSVAKAGKMTGEVASRFTAAANDYLSKDKTNPAAKKLLTWAEANGIELTKGQRLDNSVWLKLENAMSQTEVFSSHIKDFYEKQATKLSEIADGMRKKMGTEGFKDSGMATVASDSINSMQDEFMQLASANYKAIPREGGEVMLDKESSRLVKRLTDHINTIKKSVPAKRNANLLRTLEQIRAKAYRGKKVVLEAVDVQDPQENFIGQIDIAKTVPKDSSFSWNDLMDARVDIGEGIANSKGKVRGVYKDVFKMITGPDGLEESAVKSGVVSDSIREAHQVARDFYKLGKGEEGVFNNQLIKKLAESNNPSPLIKQAFKQDNLKNLKVLKKFLSGDSIDGIGKTEAWGNLTKEFTENIMTKRVDGVVSADPATLVKKLRSGGFSDDFLQTVYGKEGLEEIRILADTWDVLSKQTALFANPSGTSGPLLVFSQLKGAIGKATTGAAAGGIGTIFMGAAGGVGAVMTPSAISYLYTSKEGRKVVMDLLSTQIGAKGASKITGRAIALIGTRASRDKKRKGSPLKGTGKKGF